MPRTIRISGPTGTATLPSAASRGSETSSDEPVEAERTDARTVQQRSPIPPRMYGYTFTDDDVWFEYELNHETNLVTDARTGARQRLDPKTEVRAALAGDFNGWNLIPMVRAPRVGSRFGVRVPLATFSGDRHEFKFVLDQCLWVEPPAFAPNTAPAGIGDPNSLNLVIVLDREIEAPSH